MLKFFISSPENRYPLNWNALVPIFSSFLTIHIDLYIWRFIKLLEWVDTYIWFPNFVRIHIFENSSFCFWGCKYNSGSSKRIRVFSKIECSFFLEYWAKEQNISKIRFLYRPLLVYSLCNSLKVSIILFSASGWFTFLLSKIFRREYIKNSVCSFSEKDGINKIGTDSAI